jgi:hypothetical protein
MRRGSLKEQNLITKVAESMTTTRVGKVEYSITSAFGGDEIVVHFRRSFHGHNIVTEHDVDIAKVEIEHAISQSEKDNGWVVKADQFIYKAENGDFVLAMNCYARSRF